MNVSRFRLVMVVVVAIAVASCASHADDDIETITAGIDRLDFIDDVFARAQSYDCMVLWIEDDDANAQVDILADLVLGESFEAPFDVEHDAALVLNEMLDELECKLQSE